MGCLCCRSTRSSWAAAARCWSPATTRGCCTSPASPSTSSCTRSAGARSDSSSSRCSPVETGSRQRRQTGAALPPPPTSDQRRLASTHHTTTWRRVHRLFTGAQTARTHGHWYCRERKCAENYTRPKWDDTIIFFLSCNQHFGNFKP